MDEDMMGPTKFKITPSSRAPAKKGCNGGPGPCPDESGGGGGGMAAPPPGGAPPAKMKKGK